MVFRDLMENLVFLYHEQKRQADEYADVYVLGIECEHVADQYEIQAAVPENLVQQRAESSGKKKGKQRTHRIVFGKMVLEVPVKQHDQDKQRAYQRRVQPFADVKVQHGRKPRVIGIEYRPEIDNGREYRQRSSKIVRVDIQFDPLVGNNQ